MQSRNPVIRRAEKQYAESGPGFAAIPSAGSATAAGSASSVRYAQPPAAGSVPPGQLSDMYNRPATAGPTGVAMTIHDVIMKTALNFVILVIAAAGSWFAIDRMVPADAIPGTIPTGAYVLLFGAMIAGFGLAMVNIFKREVSPALVILYALFEGIFVGAISYVYQIIGGQYLNAGNIVLTAVVATFVVFAVMLTLYSTRIVKVNNRFKKIMFVAMISYLGFAVISLITSLFGFGDGLGFFGFGWLSVGISALVVGMAAFALCLDFDAIEEGIRYQVPERESWRMAFGLMVTIIWLYLEILRLLMLIANAQR